MNNKEELKYQSPDGAKVLQVKFDSKSKQSGQLYQSPDGAKVLQAKCDNFRTF